MEKAESGETIDSSLGGIVAEEQKTSGIPIVGFLVVEKTAGGDGYVAALMVTDNRGYPLEFKASTPIRPSLVQKTLYGGQSVWYIPDSLALWTRSLC